MQQSQCQLPEYGWYANKFSGFDRLATPVLRPEAVRQAIPSKLCELVAAEHALCDAISGHNADSREQTEAHAPFHALDWSQRLERQRRPVPGAGTGR